jgi:hypothetical protein
MLTLHVPAWPEASSPLLHDAMQSAQVWTEQRVVGRPAVAAIELKTASLLTSGRRAEAEHTCVRSHAPQEGRKSRGALIRGQARRVPNLRLYFVQMYTRVMGVAAGLLGLHIDF